MRLPNRLRELRRINSFSQEDIAKKLDISTSAYGFYEQGKTIPSAITLESLADMYDVTVDYLLGRTCNKHLATKDEVDISSTLKYLREQLERGVLRLFLDGEEVNDEAKEFILDQLENILIVTTVKYKDSLTPKKYK